MKRLACLAALAFLAAPALAQPAVTEVEHHGHGLLNDWIVAFNKGDVDGIARVYATPDTDALARRFADLRAESFGKLDVYEASFCGKDGRSGRAILKFARIYTFGGKMNDDESKIFDYEKIGDDWLITRETDGPYSAELDCST